MLPSPTLAAVMYFPLIGPYASNRDPSCAGSRWASGGTTALSGAKTSSPCRSSPAASNFACARDPGAQECYLRSKNFLCSDFV